MCPDVPPLMPQLASITAISGFRQCGGSDLSNGIESLWIDRLRPLIGPRAFVNYHPWWTNWREHAEAIWRYGRRAEKVSVAIFGYSYGGGYGAVQLARQLGKRGIKVDCMLLADPVLHHGWPLRIMRRVPSFYSLFPLCCKCPWPLNAQPRIHLPRNCNEAHVEYWYQRNRQWGDLGSWPQGHHVFYADGRQADGHEINGGMPMTHENCDNYEPFLRRCEQMARAFVDSLYERERNNDDTW